jgi:hypothetical protein
LFVTSAEINEYKKTKVIHKTYIIKQNKYIISSGIILLFLSIVLYVKNIKENIYIFYDEDIVNCLNDDYINLVDYVICYNENKIYFKKNKRKERDVLSFDKRELLTIDKLFENYYGNNFILKSKKKKFFIVLKKGDVYRIVPVNIIQFIS